MDGLLDPFLLIEGAFELDLSLMMVRVGETVPEVARGAHQQTIDRLGLNEDDYLEYRTLTYCSYKAGEIRFLGLRRAQPFLAMELCRLGLLHPKDAHHTAAEVRAWLDAEVDTLP
ncbi:MAG TPA: hypothetical protein PKY30_01620 [Myxococcota bacterium]|nr:hypothetical protein [Myxococcota bacterium]HNH45701.1 hypothetical protein [Myxococcota bacterium]